MLLISVNNILLFGNISSEAIVGTAVNFVWRAGQQPLVPILFYFFLILFFFFLFYLATVRNSPNSTRLKSIQDSAEPPTKTIGKKNLLYTLYR